MPEPETFSVETIRLAIREFGNTVAMPRGVMVDEPMLANNVLRDTANYLMFGIRAAVLGEKAGPSCTYTVTVERKVKPRYMPGFMWRRMKTETKDFTATFTPERIFPHSEIKVPKLGAPVEIVVPQNLNTYWGLDAIDDEEDED